jgi:hypothetical protein
MPVIRIVPPDPTDLVLQGEQMRAAAMGSRIDATWPWINDPPEYLPLWPLPMIAGEQSFAPMVGTYPVPPLEILRNPFDGSFIANNALICTPCGASIQWTMGNHLMNANYDEASNIFAISGVTRDSTGAVLASCDVRIEDMGQIGYGLTPYVGNTISDGSGNYSITVPFNTVYQVIAYKSGSPDVAGVSLRTVTPTHTG